MKISAKTVSLGKNEIKFTTLEQISDVRMGISSGDNPYYYRKRENSQGSFSVVEKINILSESINLSDVFSLAHQV